MIGAGLRPAQAHRVAHRPFEQQADDQQGDEIEQQRGHHLVHAQPQLEPSRSQHEQCPGQGAGDQYQRNQQRAAAGDRTRAQGHGGDRTHIELALGADVPEPGPERHRHRQPGQDQRRGAGQGLAEREPRAEARHRHLPVGGADVGAGEPQRHRGQRQRQHDRRQRCAGHEPARRMGARLKPHGALAGHQQAELARRDARGRHGGAELAPMHHRDPVGQAQQLVQVFGDQHDRGAAPPRVEQAGVHEGDRTHVEPPGRLVGQQQPRRQLQHAAEQQLLDVPARQQADALARALAAYVVGGDSSPACSARRRGAGSPALEGRPAIGLERQILGDRHVADHAVAQPILRDAADAGGGRGRAPPGGQAPPSSCRLPATGEASPASTAASARWPLPETPAMPTISCALHGQLDAGHARPAGPATATPLQLEHRPAGHAGRPGAAASPPGRPSPRRSRAGAGAATSSSATLRPARSTTTRPAQAHHLVELVADEEDRRARRAASRCSVANRPSASCGVSTAVGSSRISTRTSR